MPYRADIDPSTLATYSVTSSMVFSPLRIGFLSGSSLSPWKQFADDVRFGAAFVKHSVRDEYAVAYRSGDNELSFSILDEDLDCVEGRPCKKIINETQSSSIVELVNHKDVWWMISSEVLLGIDDDGEVVFTRDDFWTGDEDVVRISATSSATSLAIVATESGGGQDSTIWFIGCDEGE